MRVNSTVISNDSGKEDFRNPENAVRVFGPASLSNLGPGFDTLGLCLEGIGDVVEAWSTDKPGLRLEMSGDFSSEISLNPTENTAGVAALSVMKLLEMREGLVLRIYKGFTPGSGIGSSAASAAAAAWAVNEVAGCTLSKADLVEAVLAGEEVASGARHGDNALPALLGGVVLVSSQDPTIYRIVNVEGELWIALVLPEIEVLTKQARALLPATVPLQDAVNQASALAFMVDAFRSGDLATVGEWMMQDRLAEPARAELVPCYHQIKSAALEAGAFGCALTGSGPAMFAISDCQPAANKILDAMIDAAECAGVRTSRHLSKVNPDGVVELLPQISTD